jgi:hypothetical protein
MFFVIENTDQDYYTQGTILHAPTNDSHQSIGPLSCNKPLERSKMHLSFSNVGDETCMVFISLAFVF